MSRKILDVKGVNKSFGGLKALNEVVFDAVEGETHAIICLLYTSPSPRDVEESRMPSSA